MPACDACAEALPSEPITDASIYFPFQEHAASYLVTGGPKAGSTQSLGMAKGQRPDGEPAWRLQLSPSQNAFVRQTADGDVLMPAVSDIGGGVVIITTPPNPFLLEGMKPGESRTFTQSVAVNYLDNPTREDYSGSLTSTYTYIGTYRVTVPAGTYDAILLRDSRRPPGGVAAAGGIGRRSAPAAAAEAAVATAAEPAEAAAAPVAVALAHHRATLSRRPGLVQAASESSVQAS